MEIEEFKNGFVLLDCEIDKNPRIQEMITNMFIVCLKNKDISELARMLNSLLNKEIATAIFEAMESPSSAIPALKESNFTHLQFYHFLISTYRYDFFKAQIFDITGPSSIMKITEIMNRNSIKYCFIRADDKNFELDIPIETHFDVMTYFSKSLNTYINTNELEKKDLDLLLEDMENLKDNLSRIEKSIENKGEFVRSEKSNESK